MGKVHVANTNLMLMCLDVVVGDGEYFHPDPESEFC